MLCGINLPFGRLFPSTRQVAHVLLTRPPLDLFPKELLSLDLHVLGTPPAFVLSQDQTLNKKFNLTTWFLKFTRKKELLVFNFIFCSIFKDQFVCRTQATTLSYHSTRILSTTFFTFLNLLVVHIYLILALRRDLSYHDIRHYTTYNFSFS